MEVTGSGTTLTDMDRVPEFQLMFAVVPGVRPKASIVVFVHVAVEASCVPRL